MSENILKKIKAIDNQYYKSVEFIDENTVASYSFNFKENKQIFRIESNTSYHEKIVPQEFYKEQGFIDKGKFGIIRENSIIFYDIINGKSKYLKIKNPIKKLNKEEFSYFVHFSRLNEFKSIFTIQHSGFDILGSFGLARYFSTLEIKNRKKLFGKNEYANWINEPTQPDCSKFSPLYYNIGLFEKRPKDWLGIKDIISSNGRIYFYTNGGKMTRTKSGRKFEISEIGIMDLDFNIIDVKKIKDGYGKFSTNGKYFIQQDYNEKRNLNIYDLTDFSFKTVRLTPTKNLGDVKKQSLFADLFNNKLLIYDHSNITISELK
ncbi:hypothetical protein [Psychroserpens damuponensis]|uniref:hypothetical protein n=1 Tax=Psychroserpens damuponensis TaxID=943936 RepID=UPI00058F1D14|nr:hypothetical protein [Psychroserpens damuponensis]